MTDPVLSGVKPGDKLFISQRVGRDRIEPVLRITPTGRVVTQSGTFDPDGYLRRERNSWNLTHARPATFAGIYRAGLVRKIRDFSYWEKLSPDDLKAVRALIEKYEK